MATIMNPGSVNSADRNPVPEHCGNEIEQFADLHHIKRVPRGGEPPEEAARTCEAPESRQPGGWEAPDAGGDEFSPSNRRLSRGRSRV